MSDTVLKTQHYQILFDTPKPDDLNHAVLYAALDRILDQQVKTVGIQINTETHPKWKTANVQPIVYGWAEARKIKARGLAVRTRTDKEDNKMLVVWVEPVKVDERMTI